MRTWARHRQPGPGGSISVLSGASASHPVTIERWRRLLHSLEYARHPAMTNGSNTDFSIRKAATRLREDIDDHKLGHRMAAESPLVRRAARADWVPCRGAADFSKTTDDVPSPLVRFSPRLTRNELNAVVDIFSDPRHQLEMRQRLHDAGPFRQLIPSTRSRPPWRTHDLDSPQN